MTASVESAREMTVDDRHTAIVQAYVRNTYYYVGLGVGSLVGGRIVDEKGYEFMYR